MIPPRWAGAICWLAGRRWRDWSRRACRLTTRETRRVSKALSTCRDCGRPILAVHRGTVDRGAATGPGRGRPPSRCAGCQRTRRSAGERQRRALLPLPVVICEICLCPIEAPPLFARPWPTWGVRPRRARRCHAECNALPLRAPSRCKTCGLRLPYMGRGRPRLRCEECRALWNRQRYQRLAGLGTQPLVVILCAFRLLYENAL